jgi:hypothetical protein
MAARAPLVPFTPSPTIREGPGVAGGAAATLSKGGRVRRRLPLWLAAVLPAMLLGHAGGYALAGRPLIDARHGWFLFSLENSGAALIAACAILLGCALLSSNLLKRTRVEASLIQLWPRLAIAQIALFAVAENLEALHITALGIVTQLATALCFAYLISLFSRLLERCIEGSAEAAAYLERLLTPALIFAGSDPAPRTQLLFACAGTNGLQRPPPFV